MSDWDNAAARRRLEDLAHRIRHVRGDLAGRGIAAPELERDAEEMMSHHDRIRDALGAPEAASHDVVEAEVDALRASFERWVAHIEKHFAHPRINDARAKGD